MRRVVAIGGAVLLAAVGSFLLVSYVRGAERRALEGQTLIEVLVVTDPVPSGTPASLLQDSVAVRELPENAVAEGVVSDLGDLEDMITAVALVPGEPLLVSLFETPVEAAVSTRVEVPPDLLQATISLSPERAIGGRLVPGDLVAVVASFDPFALGAVEPADPESLQEALETIVLVPGDLEALEQPSQLALKTPNSTRIIIHKVLVTGVQVEELPRPSQAGTAVEFAPTGNLLVTLAARAEDLERIVFTAEHGALWLALEDADAVVTDTEIRTRGNIYE